MAAIVTGRENFAVISCNRIAVYEISSGDSDVLACVKPAAVPVKDGAAKQPGGEEGTDRVLACGFSRSGQLLAACDDYKQLWLWRRCTEPGKERWQKISSRSVVRRGTSIAFTHDDKKVLVADKSGDVYSYSTSDAEEGELLSGHMSMLLDMALTKDDAMLITCDRDEKIRVSNYPNSYSIHAFCLGHTDFVSRLHYFEEEELLLSGSGDGTLRLWDYKTGTQLCKSECCKHIPQSCDENNQSEGQQGSPDKSDQSQKKTAGHMTDVRCLACCKRNHLIAVFFDKSSSVLLYKMADTPPSLDFVQRLDLAATVWSVAFDSDGHLWVLSADAGRHMTCYAYDVEALQLSEVSAETPQQAVLKKINSNPDYFKGADSVDSIFPMLHKQRIDNMSEYLDKKQQRLTDQKQKRKLKDKRRNKRRGGAGGKRAKGEGEGEDGEEEEDEEEEEENGGHEEEPMEEEKQES